MAAAGADSAMVELLMAGWGDDDTGSKPVHAQQQQPPPVAGAGAPPPLVGMGEPDQATSPAAPASATTAAAPAATATAGGGFASLAVGQPPELLPPGLEAAAVAAAAAAPPQSRQPHGTSPTGCPPELLPLDDHSMETPQQHEKLRTIQAKKEELQKQLERLQAEEEQLGGPPGMAGDFPLPTTPQGGRAAGPPELLMPGLLPHQGHSPQAHHNMHAGQPQAAAAQQQPGQPGAARHPGAAGGGGGGGGSGPGIISLEQANRMASVGWNFAQPASLPPHFAHHQHHPGMLPPQHHHHGMAMQPKIDAESMVQMLASSPRLVDFVREPLALSWLQKVCEDGQPHELDAIFEVLRTEQVEVFTDPTTSTIIPVIFGKVKPEQQLQLLEKLQANFSNVAFNMHGTRVIQKVIEQINPTSADQIALVVASLAHQVTQLVKDLNGNHIIQECLQTFPPEANQTIHDVLAARVVEFGTHRHGCCVLQRCIEHGNNEQKMRLVTEIINNGLFLVQDPFGNYLLQYILEMDIDVINVKVIRQFLGHIPALSMNKFASNVIEKCLKIAPDDIRTPVIEEIGDRTKLPLLLQDQYANYVVQTALHTCNQQQFYQLQATIRPLLQLIKNTPHGKRIETKLRTRTFDNSHAGNHIQSMTPPRRHYERGPQLGVTPDGQWLRGGVCV